MRILIVDDNVQITEVLKAFALKEGMEVEVSFNGEEAWKLFKSMDFDILLLDIMMPRLNGYDLLKRIRQESMIPVILITAKGEDYERIMGLDYGADDYIVKPFSVAEVMARIRAILRRVQVEDKEEEIQIDGLQLNLTGYRCLLDDEEISLTKKEFELIWQLAAHPGRVFTRENLLDSLWGEDYYGDPRTVDTHIKRLRAKLGQDHHRTWKIETVRGLGYKFEVEE